MRILILMLLGMWFVHPPASPPPSTLYVGGIQINEADQVEWAKTLKSAGMNLVQVTAYAKQGDWNTDHLWWEKEDTTNVINEIRAVKSQGVKVIMVLRVAMQHEGYNNKFLWHGMIFPQDDAARKEWFYRYNYFVEMWAKICEREGVDVLAVASEMNAMTATDPLSELPELLSYFSSEQKQRAHMSKILKYTDVLKAENLWVRGFENYSNPNVYIQDKIKAQKKWADIVTHDGEWFAMNKINGDRKDFESNWRNVIRNARKHFSGTLTMAANFDNYHEITFWDELDCLGINAYFPLRTLKPQRPSDSALKKELIQGWEKVFNDIDALKKAQGVPNHPVFFTELGYTPKQDCTVEPWEGFGFSHISNNYIDTLLIWDKAPIVENERIMAVDALREVVQDQNYPLIGLSYWKMTTHDYHAGHEPFMLLVDEDAQDGLQESLAKFLE